MVVRLLCVCSLVAMAFATTQYIVPEPEILPDGTALMVCRFRGITFLQGSSFKTRDCLKCTFDGGSCSCVGFGIKAGSIAAQPGCKIIANGCDPLEVMADDETLACGTGKPIKKT